MKKILIFLVIVLIVVAVVTVRYFSYDAKNKVIGKGNLEYEQYKDKEIYGLDVATLINRAIDENTKNRIKKDDKGMFIQNETDSIEIEIYMQDNETTYKMEQFYNSGTEKFVQYYGNIKFKCSKIEYHKETGKIKYMFFEQLQTS